MSRDSLTSIDKFTETLLADIVKFEAWWRASRVKDPKNFPLLMSEVDWMAQFLVWQTSKEQKR